MADIFVISQISEKFSKKFQKFNFSAVFKNFLIFFFDLGQLDIAFMVCIKEWEYNTPKYVFSWGGEFHPPPQHSGNRYAVGNRVNNNGEYLFMDDEHMLLAVITSIHSVICKTILELILILCASLIMLSKLGSKKNLKNIFKIFDI